MARTTKKTTKKKFAKKTAKRAGAGSGKESSSSWGMGKNLVVVESPAKAKTINRYLGPDYIVKASMGHVRDLPKKDIGVDTEKRFEPTYEPLPGRKKILTELKRYAKAAPQVFLATDLDREGEAIAWHLAESLGVPPDRIRRVIFNEITASAIQQAFAMPRDIDMDKVNAQQARRILDRLVGYQISPLLWRKVAKGLSAGRVQSVAVRLIVERESEIEAFMPEEYWRIIGVLTGELNGADELGRKWARFLAQRDEKDNGPTRVAQQAFLADHGAFRAELVRFDGQRFKCDNVEEAARVARAIGMAIAKIDTVDDPDGKGPAAKRVTVTGEVASKDDPASGRPAYVVRDIRRRDSRSRPPAPFTTASMQQAASVQMRFGAQRTMRTAQQLYEGIDVPGEGTVGLITYMRTDSTHLSNEALTQVRAMIGERFGPQYVPDKPNVFAAGKRAQEAHEAVRPTDVTRRPEDLRGALSAEQFKLYELIWKRFVSCQMSPAMWKITEADIVVATPAGEAIFKAVGRQLDFDGFLRVAGLPRGGDQILPTLTADQEVAPVQLDTTQHFTQPPPRYTEASLVKAMEADGIGRPSTYAAIIQTIQAREYVKLVERSFCPTDLGVVVTGKLVTYFPETFDVRFTAHMEEQLDEVEHSSADWVHVLEAFYGPFQKRLAHATEEMVHARAETQPSDYTCKTCDRPMVYRFSRNGRYLACTGYPDCQQTHPVDSDGKIIERKTVDVACPKCNKPLLLRRGRFGPFLSCAQYPECDGVVNLDRKGFVKHPSAPPLEIEHKCPKCDSPLYLRRGKRGPWLACSKYPKCRGRLGWTTLDDAQRAALEKKLVQHEMQNPQPIIKKVDGTPIGADYQPVEIEV